MLTQVVNFFRTEKGMRIALIVFPFLLALIFLIYPYFWDKPIVLEIPNSIYIIKNLKLLIKEAPEFTLISQNLYITLDTISKILSDLSSKIILIALLLIFLSIIIAYLVYKNQDYQKCLRLENDLENFKNLLQKNNRNYDIKNQIDIFCQQESEKNPDYSLGKVWIEFTEGLVETDGKYRNTFQAEDFFTEKDIIKPKLDLLEHMPGLCSALGLLFTFVALGEGLGHLKMNGTEIEGIQDFINALSSKFITSIIGLYLALVIDAILVRKFTKSYKNTLFEINTLLNSNFSRITVQELVKDLKKTVVEELPGKIEQLFNANNSSQTILTGLKQVISESVNSSVEGIKTEMDKISQSMQSFSSAGIDGMATQLASIGKDLRESLTQGISKDLEGLKSIFENLPNLINESMREMADSTKQIKSSLEESQQEMSRLIKQVFEEINSKQGDGLNSLLENIVTKNTEIMDKISVHQENMQARQEEAFNSLTTKLADNNDNISKQMQEVVQTIIDNLSQQTNNMTNSLGESTKNLMNDYAQFADRSKSSLDEGYKQIIDNQEAFKQSIIDILNKFDGSFNPLLTELKANVGELSRQTLRLPEELNKSSNSLQESMQALKRILQTDLAEYLQTQSRITQDQSKTLSELGAYLTAISELQKESRQIQDLMTMLVNYQNNFEQNMKNRDFDIKQHLENVTAGIARQRDLIQEHNKSADILKSQYQDINNLIERVSNNFGDMGESLAGSISELKESSNTYHIQLAESSRRALEALTSYAEELRSHLDSKIEGLLQR
jgi:hypothetical protein